MRNTLIRRGQRNTAFNASGLYVIGRLFHYGILFIGLMIALASLGLELSNLALVAGALSVGIGFGCNPSSTISFPDSYCSLSAASRLEILLSLIQALPEK